MRQRGAQSGTARRRRINGPGVLRILLLMGACAFVLSACGGPTEPQSPLEKAKEILGRPPKGLAAKVVKRGELVVANSAEYPPLSYVDEDGEFVGFDVEVAKATADYLGLKVSFVQPDREAVPAGLAAGRFDVSIGSVSPQQGYGDAVAYSKPYYYTTAQLVVKADAPMFEGVSSLDGKVVGAGVHTVFFAWLQEHGKAQLKAFSTDSDALAALEAGRVDAVLTSGLTAAEVVEGGKLQASGAPLFAEPMTFAVDGGQKDLLKLMNAAIADLRRSGGLRSISKQLLGADFTRATTSTGSSSAP